MKKLLIALILGVMLFSIPVLSETSQHSVVVEIFPDNTAHYQINVSSTESFSLLIRNPENLVSNCIITEETLGTRLKCAGDSRIDYDSSVEKQDGFYLFSDAFDVPFTKNFILILKIPEGTGLKKPIENSYRPGYALVGSDGRRPVITWQREDYSGQFQVSVAFESVIVSSPSLEPIILGIILVVGVVGSFYVFYTRKRGVEVIFPVLKSDEKAVFNAIMKHGSGVKQKKVVEGSGYSKAKVSKVLRSLEERGLVQLERIGRSNKVHIVQKIENKA